ncbi:MAG: hypothetical protein ABW203_09455 [Novosphingobium sp.]
MRPGSELETPLRSPTAFTALAAVLLSGCGGGTSEHEAALRQQLDEANARADRAEAELAKAQKLLARPVDGDTGFDDEPSEGSELAVPDEDVPDVASEVSG